MLCRLMLKLSIFLGRAKENETVPTIDGTGVRDRNVQTNEYRRRLEEAESSRWRTC